MYGNSHFDSIMALSGPSAFNANSPHKSEKTPEQAAALADLDVSQPTRAFLREIYKEAYNAEQLQDDRMSKVLMKCSALFVKLTEDNAQMSAEHLKTSENILNAAQANLKLQKRLEHLTWALVILTVVLAGLTVALLLAGK